MEEFLKGVLALITTIFTALLIFQITNRRKKEKEMEELINQKADKIDLSKKADKEYVEKELCQMKDTLRTGAERDAEIHAGMYKMMHSIDRKLDILIQQKNATN